MLFTKGFIPKPDCVLVFHLIMFLIFCGCEKYRSLVPPAGPDYGKPKTDLPDSWYQPPDPALIPTKMVIQRWWTVFNDPMMDQFIAQAEKSNLDLRVAVARVKEARAYLSIRTLQARLAEAQHINPDSVYLGALLGCAEMLLA